MNYNSTIEFSTQPFAILDLHDDNVSSLSVFNKDLSTPVLSPLVQFSGQLVSQYQIEPLVNDETNINHISKKSKKKKKKRLHDRLRRSSAVKQRMVAYFKKLKLKQQRSKKPPINNVLTVAAPPEPKQIESTPIEHSSMIDFQLMPDLSKRKYIFKDISLTTNSSNQMNWVNINKEMDKS